MNKSQSYEIMFSTAQFKNRSLYKNTKLLDYFLNRARLVTLIRKISKKKYYYLRENIKLFNLKKKE